MDTALILLLIFLVLLVLFISKGTYDMYVFSAREKEKARDRVRRERARERKEADEQRYRNEWKVKQAREAYNARRSREHQRREQQRHEQQRRNEQSRANAQRRAQNANQNTNRDDIPDSNVLASLYMELQKDFQRFKLYCKVVREQSKSQGINGVKYTFGNATDFIYVRAYAKNNESSGTIEFQKKMFNFDTYSYANKLYRWKINASEFNQFFKIINDFYAKKKEPYSYGSYTDSGDFFNDDFFNDFFKNDQEQQHRQQHQQQQQRQEEQQRQQQRQRQQPKKKAYNDKNIDHKRYPLYTKLRETVEARDAQLKEVKSTDSDYEGLKNERDAAKRKMDTLKKKYGF